MYLNERRNILVEFSEIFSIYRDRETESRIYLSTLSEREGGGGGGGGGGCW